MTWRELVEADDLATSLVVDPFLGFKTHKMTEYASILCLLVLSSMRMRLSDRVKGRLKNIIFDFQKDKDYEKAYTDLLGNDVNIKRSLKADGRFRMHVSLAIQNYFFRYIGTFFFSMIDQGSRFVRVGDMHLNRI